MTNTIDLKKYFSSIKYISLMIACLFFCVMLIVDFEVCKKSIAECLIVCSQTLVPSLFPFMFIASFITLSGVLDIKSKILDKVSYTLFGLPYCAFAVFILSIIGGFPVGGKMTKNLYERKLLTQNQANRLLLFCINPSPAFAINAVGTSLFGNKQIGIIIYFSVILANMILSVLSRCIDDKKSLQPVINKRSTISSAFIKAGSDASTSMISICSNVLLFSCFLNLITNYIENMAVKNFLFGITEVTLACQNLCKINNLPLIAGVIAWGGLAVHFQIMDCINVTGTELHLFWTSRIVSAALSVIICDGLFKLFPVQVSVLSQNNNIILAPNENSLPVSVAMLLTCFLFLIGDYTINSRIKRYKDVETEQII